MAKGRVLLADNSEEWIRIYGKIIESAGYQVESSSDFEGVKNLIRNRVFDVAVLDLHWRDDNDVDDLSGLDLARTVSRFTPCIFLTGGAEARTAVMALRRQRDGGAAVDLIMKGKDSVSTLLEAIESALVPRVFVVHGHDEDALRAVELFLGKVGVQPIILRDQPALGKSINEKFEHYADVGFAVVILTPDDVGGKDLTPLVPQHRARQNVIFELGYFFGRLGRIKVAALYKEGEKKIELPSDYHGVQYIAMGLGKEWQFELLREMEVAGVKVNRSRF